MQSEVGIGPHVTQMQNVPFYLKEANLNLKALFIADSDEYDIYDLDIKNAEMRVLCAYSEDDAMIEAFNSGMDLHSLTASGISDFTYDEIMANKEDDTSEHYRQRQVAKKVNFGTIYLMGAETLAHNLWKEMRIQITVEEAARYLSKFFLTYPNTQRYIEATQRFAQRFKFTHTFTGRRRRFPIAAYSTKQVTRAGRQAVNGRIQTTSADIVGMNMVDLDRAIEPLGGRMGLSVHDSMMFMLPKGTPGVKQLLDQVIVENTREKCPWLPVEWAYDVGRGPSYGEAKLPLDD